MALSVEAQKIYGYLVESVVPLKKVVTYGDVSQATNVPFGEGGGAIGKVLGEVARACQKSGLPPLTAIVVRSGGRAQYDSCGRHGMPGIGFFVMRSEFDDAFANWGKKPAPPGFHPEIDCWRLREVVEAHQNDVWKKAVWPAAL